MEDWDRKAYRALNANLQDLAGRVLRSYDADARTTRIGDTFLPTRSEIVLILDLVRQVLFPGYFGQKRLTRENIQFHVGNLLHRVGIMLADQIYNCKCAADRCPECKGHAPCRQEAEDKARRFLARIPKIREALALDAEAAYDGDPAAKSISEVIYCYPGFYAVVVYRIAHELLNLGVPLMPRIMSEHAHSAAGADIHPGAEIGKRFFIDHSTGVVIGETSRIGDNVKIYQGVTLGAKSFPKDERGRVIKGIKRHPTIEDNVTIYANATILGGETIIGQGVTVTGNTFVQDSITADSVVKHKTPELEVRRKTRPAVGQRS